MSCRRVRRALFGMTRFGEFGPDSEHHLDHLAACRACREEVGCDRALIRQLRAALAARVDGMEPSESVWDQVRVLAQQPERGRFRWPWRRASDAIGVTRSLTAMAGTGLALVLALNTQVVTVQPSASELPSAAAATPVTAGPVSGGERVRRVSAGAMSTGQPPRITISAVPDPEGLLMNVDARAVTASLADPAPDEPSGAAATEATFVVRPPLGPEPPPATERGTAGSDEADEAVEPPPPAGEPT
jgi:hypothetical protein